MSINILISSSNLRAYFLQSSRHLLFKLRLVYFICSVLPSMYYTWIFIIHGFFGLFINNILTLFKELSVG
nr:MAG TPA: hypothetical protein [Caudoviricetes sp.]DAL91581.1 MAG TPA: hypothetical protein [Caudoviricetes sp.]